MLVESSKRKQSAPRCPEAGVDTFGCGTERCSRGVVSFFDTGSASAWSEGDERVVKSLVHCCVFAFHAKNQRSGTLQLANW